MRRDGYESHPILLELLENPKASLTTT